MSDLVVLKVVPCESCGLRMEKLDSRPEPHWEPHVPYWEPRADRLYCRPDYWRALYGTEPPKAWRLRK